MESLPLNEWISQKYCDNWCGILNIDGKYVKVRGYDKKIPFIYCMDYHTHDIVAGVLCTSESFNAFFRLFELLGRIRYPLRLVVGDDSDSLKLALQSSFPGVNFQLCHTHYLENIRQALEIRTEDKYRNYFEEFVRVFKRGISFSQRMFMLSEIDGKYGQMDKLLLGINQNVRERYGELFAFERSRIYAPHSNNLIESYNSQLEGRLGTIKGFKTKRNAERWLNAWMIRRRLKPPTDCEKPFKHLNGKCSLEMSIKSGKLPKIL